MLLQPDSLYVSLNIPEARGPRAQVWSERASTALLFVLNLLDHLPEITTFELFYMQRCVFLVALCCLLFLGVSASGLQVSFTWEQLYEVNTGSQFFLEYNPQNPQQRASKVLPRTLRPGLLKRCAGKEWKTWKLLPTITLCLSLPMSNISYFTGVIFSHNYVVFAIAGTVMPSYIPTFPANRLDLIK